MAQTKLRPIIMENARIAFRNFSGNPGKFNAEGQRNFCVFLDDQLAADMAADGWNIKYLKPRDEEDAPQAYIQAKVNLRGNRPPRCVLITSRGRTDLNEVTVGILDWVEIANVDLILNPSPYDFNGKSGISCYLKSIFITIEEDYLERKYADVPENRLDTAPERLKIESGGRIPIDPDEIVIEDEDLPPWAQ